MGEVSADGFLTITGRTKINSKLIRENTSRLHQSKWLALNTDVEQVCVVGMGVPQTHGVDCVVGWEKLNQKMSWSPALVKSIQELNPSLESYEAIEKSCDYEGRLDDWEWFDRLFDETQAKWARENSSSQIPKVVPASRKSSLGKLKSDEQIVTLYFVTSILL